MATLLHDLIPETKETTWGVEDEWTPVLKSQEATLYLDKRVLVMNNREYPVTFDLEWCPHETDARPLPEEDVFEPFLMRLRNCQYAGPKGPLSTVQTADVVEMDFKTKRLTVWTREQVVVYRLTAAFKQAI